MRGQQRGRARERARERTIEGEMKEIGSFVISKLFLQSNSTVSQTNHFLVVGSRSSGGWYVIISKKGGKFYFQAPIGTLICYYAPYGMSRERIIYFI